MPDTIASCVESRRHEHGRDFAVFSPDRAYRYELTRRWGHAWAF